MNMHYIMHGEVAVHSPIKGGSMMRQTRKATSLPPPYGQEAIVVDVFTHATYARIKKTAFKLQVYKPNAFPISFNNESDFVDYLHSEFPGLYGFDPHMTLVTTRRARFAKDRS